MEREEFIGSGQFPGKFEGEPDYVAFYWALALEAGAPDDDDGWITISVDAEDRATWPVLEEIAAVRLFEDDNGFVYKALVRKA